MKLIFNRLIAAARFWLTAFALLSCLCGNAFGQVIVTDYFTFSAALQTSNVITTFGSNSFITLTNSSQTLEITANVFIDAGSNNIVVDGSSTARMFHVHPNCQLTLNNLQLLNGRSALGAAIYNEGTLIISNCIISGNAATNLNGIDGSTNITEGNGGNATSGGSVAGGAIYSTGPLYVYYTVFGTNSAFAGEGGLGGDGGSSPFFGGNGGNGGNGGSASGAAIYSRGSNNVFYADEFIGNESLAGTGGSGGNAGAGGVSGGNTGQGGIGGSAVGGALCIAGNLSISNCLFYLNKAQAGGSAGAQLLFDGEGSDGPVGSSASGGGLYISATVAHADIENTLFVNNSCIGGEGGGAAGESAIGGNGGQAIGGGLDSAAARATMISCTLATNTLTGGTNGSGAGGSGAFGATLGWDLCASTGALRLSDSILSGGVAPPPNSRPNAFGVIDGGNNVCSDSSLAHHASTTILAMDPELGPGLITETQPVLGPAGIVAPKMLTFPILGGPASSLVPGVPGISFPARDLAFQARGTPATAGAFQLAAIAVSSNAFPPTILTQPVTQTKNAGDTATFTISAQQVTNSVALPLGYQWQLNGTNLPENSTFHGATTPTLTVKGVTFANQGPYQVIVGASTLTGVSTSAVARLVLVAPPKITVQPARKLNEPSGAIVSFKVTAIGAEPMSFQWLRNSENLSDGDEISGSTTSILTIDPATPIDAGSYSVLVTNAYGSVASISVPLTIVADNTRPTVTVTSPAGNARTINPLITGKASDNAQVTSVSWWLTNINAGVITVTSGVASLDTAGTTAKTWTIPNAPAPGSNILAVQATDYSGNLSPVVTRRFFFIVPSRFELAVNGNGTAKGSASITGNIPPINGAMLNIGESYTLNAIPGRNAIFANWTLNGIPSYSPKLRLIMEPGLQIVAYFNSNTLVHASEIYNGLFYDETNGVSEETAGMLSQLTIDATRLYSGKLLFNGETLSLAGQFNPDGTATNLIVRADSKGGPVKVQLSLQSATSQIRGTVSGSNPKPWTSTLFAEASVGDSSSSGYTYLLVPATNANIPVENAHLLLTNVLGEWLSTGALPDGTALSQMVQRGRLGDVPIFANLYGSNGLLLGWIGFSNGSTADKTPLIWIKPSAGSEQSVKGFTNRLFLVQPTSP